MTAASVSDANFEKEVLQSDEPVVVDFCAEWCGPCKAMAPALDQVAAQFAGRVKVVRFDVRDSKNVSAEYGVRALPTLILFEGGKAVARHVGALVQKEKLEEKINSMVAVGLQATSESRATKFKLANGMDVVVIADHQTPDVTHMLWYRVGAADAPQGASGIANFLEHLMFKSIEQGGVGEYSNIRIGQDFTAYHQRIAKHELKALMETEAKRMTSLRLADEEVATGLKFLIQQCSLIAKNPLARLERQINAALYGSHPYGNPEIGLEPEIANLSGEDLRCFHERYYRPNNSILVVAGDVTAKEVQRLAEETYGQIPSHPQVDRSSRPTELQPVIVPRISEKDPRVGLAAFQRNYLVPSYVTAKRSEAEALELLMQIIGDSASGRLHRKLVEGELAPMTEGQYLGSTIGPGVIKIRALKIGDHRAVEEAVDSVLNDIRENGVTELELERAKKNLRTEYIYSTDNNEALARRYGTALSIGRSIESIESWSAALTQVTADDIKKVAVAYLDPRRSVTGWLLAGESQVRGASEQAVPAAAP
jgi:zinc protease